MLRLWAEGDQPDEMDGAAEVDSADVACANRCCAPDAVDRARHVADQLGVPFHLLDAKAPFRAQVVDYFIAEYAAGRTPNPCVLCNRFVRFDFLLNWALAQGATHIATGHYARVRPAEGNYQLLRGLDPRKDQSYFLHALNQAQLAHTLFPLGELTKDQVRALARQHGLDVAEQPESQDVCFLPDGDHRRFLACQVGHLYRPGPIYDTFGRVLGQHQGLPGYTIGQRKGLGITAPEPLYVLAIEMDRNALIVGTAQELGQEECLVEGMHTIDGAIPRDPFRSTAQIRYHARLAGVTVTPVLPERARIRFDSSQRDLTPGQFLVLYDGEVVLGGGVICKPQQPML